MFPLCASSFSVLSYYYPLFYICMYVSFYLYYIAFFLPIFNFVYLLFLFFLYCYRFTLSSYFMNNVGIPTYLILTLNCHCFSPHMYCDLRGFRVFTNLHLLILSSFMVSFLFYYNIDLLVYIYVLRSMISLLSFFLLYTQ